MIIRRLQAQDMLKYARLDLADLPEAGRILISGVNESGKTAIVEGLCLALFGRTVALDASQLSKAIRWGADAASVSLDFTGQDGQSYTVFRSFDAEGGRQARLERSGAEPPLAQGVAAVDQAVMAACGFDFQSFTDTLYLSQGPADGETQAETIKTLAGVNVLEALMREMDGEIAVIGERIIADEAQAKELLDRLGILNVQADALGALQTRRDTVSRQMDACDAEQGRWQAFSRDLAAAAEVVDGAADRLLACDLETTLEAWQEGDRQLAAALAGVAGVCRDSGVEVDGDPATGLGAWRATLQESLAALTDITRAVAAQRRELDAWLGGGPTAAEDDDGPETLASARAAIDRDTGICIRQRRRNSNWTLLFFFLALLGAAPLGVMRFLPGIGLVELLQERLPFWQPGMELHVAGISAAFLLLVLRGWVRALKLGRTISVNRGRLAGLDERAETAREQLEIIDSALGRPLHRKVSALSRLQGAPWAAALTQWSGGHGRALLDESDLSGWLDGLRSALEAFREEMAGLEEQIRGQAVRVVADRASHAEAAAVLDREIAGEQARRREDASLREQVAAQERSLAARRRQVAVRRRALELLHGTSRGLSGRFNQELRRFIVRSVPLFTAGRYQHLRIDDDLRVAAFSTAKNDFVDLEEISTGVRQQLMLAVRMALAQALAARSGFGSAGAVPQFIVLDEPFVFFDNLRLRTSLDALPGISGQITQIWVIAQHFDADIVTASDLFLECNPDNDTLTTARG